MEYLQSRSFSSNNLTENAVALLFVSHVGGGRGASGSRERRKAFGFRNSWCRADMGREKSGTTPCPCLHNHIFTGRRRQEVLGMREWPWINHRGRQLSSRGEIWRSGKRGELYGSCASAWLLPLPYPYPTVQGVTYFGILHGIK